MFSRMFGNYLVQKGYISSEKYQQITEKIESSRVKLGLIAVAEGYMTKQQADEINRIQAVEDKRFGDIAIEKKYLSKEGLEDVLSKQGDRYLALLQNVVENTDITLEKMEDIVDAYKMELNCDEEEFSMMRAGDMDVILAKTLKTHNPNLLYITGLVVRNIVRFITTDIVVDKVKSVKEYNAKYFAYQNLVGEIAACLGFASEEDGILVVASKYAREEFTEVDEDSYDAVCEFINCINGLFATKFSAERVNVDMLPPLYKTDATITVPEGDIYVVDMKIDNKKMSVVFSLHADTSVVYEE